MDLHYGNNREEGFIQLDNYIKHPRSESMRLGNRCASILDITCGNPSIQSIEVNQCASVLDITCLIQSTYFYRK
ncbi:hypothetical protein RDI58_013578 [Solanum bulbocastanum]|uniref:Uncharacterized protein n=1 Tax=Solanum bulbocastanum TaxID=147425 RepID=A0AAN8YHW5_SOLBU